MVEQPLPKGAWRVTFLLFLFLLVNFADKIVVGPSGVPMIGDLRLAEPVNDRLAFADQGRQIDQP
jgi:MFS transporter, ACS family, D-galactonate transporter